MYYINSTPNESGNHGNPMGQPFPGCLTLPDDLLAPYIEARGFVTLTMDGTTVTAVETHQEALEAYLKEYPDVEPEEPEDDRTAVEQEITDLMLADMEQGQFATALQLQLMEVTQHV